MQEEKVLLCENEACSAFPASSRVAEGVIFKQNKKVLGCFPSSLPQQPASWCGGGACDDQSLEKSVLSRYTVCL